MAANASNNASTLATLTAPPEAPDHAYVLPALCGEIIYIPLSKSATRLLVTGKETRNAFAVVGSGGTQSPPIGFHFHRDSHDVFLCLKGSVNVWADDKCRTMGPGDFASVPPTTIHQYQILGPHSEFLGLIVPGGWEEFFRFIGEPYAGPLFPLEDDRNPFEVLIPKLKAAAEEFDMVPCPQKAHFDPQPWAEDDNKIPEGLEPYFLKAGTGPAKVLAGTVVRPLVMKAQSRDRFEIGALEGTDRNAPPVLNRGVEFDGVHHCLQLVDGKVEFTVGGKSAVLSAGETIFVPAGVQFGFKYASSYAKMYVFANGGGLVDLLWRLGKDYTLPLPPEKADGFDSGALEGLGKELGFRVA